MPRTRRDPAAPRCLGVIMRMRIDKARSDNLALGVDLLLATRGHFANRDDLAGFNCNIGLERIPPAAVDNRAATDDKIHHGLLPPILSVPCREQVRIAMAAKPCGHDQRTKRQVPLSFRGTTEAHAIPRPLQSHTARGRPATDETGSDRTVIASAAKRSAAIQLSSRDRSPRNRPTAAMINTAQYFTMVRPNRSRILRQQQPVPQQRCHHRPNVRLRNVAAGYRAATETRGSSPRRASTVAKARNVPSRSASSPPGRGPYTGSSLNVPPAPRCPAGGFPRSRCRPHRPAAPAPRKPVRPAPDRSSPRAASHRKPPAAGQAPASPGKATSSAGTSVPSAIRGSRLSGGARPDTTHSSSATSSARTAGIGSCQLRGLMHGPLSLGIPALPPCCVPAQQVAPAHWPAAQRPASPADRCAAATHPSASIQWRCWSRSAWDRSRRRAAARRCAR